MYVLSPKETCDIMYYKEYYMPYRYTFFDRSKKPRYKTLVVEPAVHALIKAYALDHNITIIEAVHDLVVKGLGVEIK